MMEATVDTPTAPVSTSEQSPAASATSTPASDPSTPGGRPTSFVEAFEQIAAKEIDGAAPPDPAATAQAAPQDPNAIPTEKKGPIPFDVHKKTLDNAYAERDSARLEVSQARERLASVLNIPAAELTEVVQFSKSVASDPIGHTFGMLNHLLSDPQHGPAVRSELARAFGGLRNSAAAPQPVAVDYEPDVQIVGTDGQVTGGTYSKEKMLAIVQAEIDKKVNPLAQDYQTRQQQQQRQAEQAKAAQIQADLNTRADKTLTEMTRILGGDKSLLHAADQLWAQHPDWTPHEVALEIREKHIEPRLQGNAQQAAISTFKTKAAGNTANGTSASALPARPTNAAELAQYMEALDARTGG